MTSRRLPPLALSMIGAASASTLPLGSAVIAAARDDRTARLRARGGLDLGYLDLTFISVSRRAA